MTRIYGRYIELVNGTINQLITGGAPPCMDKVMAYFLLQYLLVLNLRRVAGWVAGGCWDDEITSEPVDHSRKFPTFSTSKNNGKTKIPFGYLT